jgi:hypothetical protein
MKVERVKNAFLADKKQKTSKLILKEAMYACNLQSEFLGGPVHRIRSQTETAPVSVCNGCKGTYSTATFRRHKAQCLMLKNKTLSAKSCSIPLEVLKNKQKEDDVGFYQTRIKSVQKRGCWGHLQGR